jgi:hypothetical protein
MVYPKCAERTLQFFARWLGPIACSGWRSVGIGLVSFDVSASPVKLRSYVVVSTRQFNCNQFDNWSESRQPRFVGSVRLSMLKPYRANFLLISDIWSTCKSSLAAWRSCCLPHPELGVVQCHSHHIARATLHLLTTTCWLQNMCRGAFPTKPIYSVLQATLAGPNGIACYF